MQIVYLLFVVVLIMILITQKRNISLIVVYFLSSIIYYFNAFQGEIFVGKLNHIGVSSYAVNSGFYIVLLINLTLILGFVLIGRENTNYCAKHQQVAESTAMKIVFCGVLALAIYMCFKHNVFSRTIYSKSTLAESTGGLAAYYKYFSSFVFVYIFSKEETEYGFGWKIIATIPLLTTFLFGNRSYLIISLIAIMFNYVYKVCLNDKLSFGEFLIKHKKFLIVATVLFFVTLIVKGITGALFIGDYDIVIERLTNIEYYKQVFYVSEPNTISQNLNSIVDSNYSVPKSSYMALWAYFIPLVTGSIEKALGVTNFTKEYQLSLYGDDTNNASTYLGEAYANGGYLFVILVVFFYLLLITLLFKLYKNCKSNITKTTVLIMGIDASFYIHRNSIAFEFSRLRAYIYIAILIYLIIGILNSVC